MKKALEEKLEAERKKRGLFGSKYVGEFKGRKRYGKGTLIFPDCRKIKGIWENGRLGSE